jgi:hypothetical protein
MHDASQHPQHADVAALTITRVVTGHPIGL